MSKFNALNALMQTLGIASAEPSPVTLPPAADGGDPESGAASVAGIAEADVTRLVADAHAKGRKDGFAAAQDRMVTVMASDAAKAQPSAAVKLMAKSPDMSAEDVIETLAELTPVAPAAVNPVGADLNNTPQPKIGPATGKPGGAVNEDSDMDSVAFWDGIQGTKGGVRVGGTGFGAAN